MRWLMLEKDNIVEDYMEKNKKWELCEIPVVLGVLRSIGITINILMYPVLF